MSYVPHDPRITSFFIYYIFISAFGLLITIKMSLNYYKKKNKAALYMSMTFAAFSFAVIVLAIGILEGIITGYSKEIYRFSLPFAYSMVVIANIFLYKFVNYLTDRGRKAYFPVFLIGLVLIVVLFLPWNFWGTPTAEIGRPYIRLYSTLGLVVYSYIIYISIIIICQISKNYSASRINRLHLSLFSWAIVSLLFFFLMFIFDTLLLVFTDSPGYSIFVYFAWLFASLFLTLSYLSLVLHEEEVHEVLEMIAKLKRKKLTEEEIIYHKEKKICLVCKSRISRRKKYICPECDILYCLRCSNALSNLDNYCWICETRLDPSKSFKLPENEEDRLMKFKKSK